MAVWPRTSCPVPPPCTGLSAPICRPRAAAIPRCAARRASSSRSRAAHRHRPGQADMLHVDPPAAQSKHRLDVVLTATTCCCPGITRVAHTLYHNTVSVDGLDQMERAGRFLGCRGGTGKRGACNVLLAGATGVLGGRSRRLSPLASAGRPPARHPAPAGVPGSAAYRWHSEGAHRYRLHWLLPDLAYTWQADPTQLTLQTVAGAVPLATGSVGAGGRCYPGASR